MSTTDPSRDLQTAVRRLHRHIDKLKYDILPRLPQTAKPGWQLLFLAEAIRDLDTEIAKLRCHTKKAPRG